MGIWGYAAVLVVVGVGLAIMVYQLCFKDRLPSKSSPSTEDERLGEKLHTGGNCIP